MVFFTLDPGSERGKNLYPGPEINIPDPQHCPGYTAHKNYNRPEFRQDTFLCKV